MLVRGGRTLARAVSRSIFELRGSYRTVCKTAAGKPSISGENNHFERFWQIFWAVSLIINERKKKELRNSLMLACRTSTALLMFSCTLFIYLFLLTVVVRNTV